MLRVLLIALFSLSLFAESIKVGISDNRPLNFIDNGKAQGLYIDILNYVSKKHDIEIEYIYGGLSEIVNKLKTKEVDVILSMAQTKDGEENLYFNREKVFLNWGQVFSIKNDYESIFDLRDKNIAVLKDDIHYIGKDGIKALLAKFYIKVNFIECNSVDSVFKLLTNSSVDVAVVSRLSGVIFANKYSFISTELIFNPISLKFATTVNNTKSKELLNLIDKELVELKKDENSLYYQSFTKWLKYDRWRELEKIKNILYILLVIILILISANFLLKREIKKRQIIELELKNKSEELKKINLELENRVKVEVEKRINQDNILIQQSKMATIGEMIGAIGHQWKQPLNVISIVVQLLEFNMENDELNKEETAKNINTIYTQINFMAQTIDDFKNFFKPQKVKQNFSIEDEINNVIKLIGFSFVKNSIIINIDKKSNDIVSGYPNEFKQVVLNILNNAKDAILDIKKKLHNKIVAKLI